jgi:hypothetical protein
VDVALRSGESVHIRPATESELIPYKNMLQRLQHEWANKSLNQTDAG